MRLNRRDIGRFAWRTIGAGAAWSGAFGSGQLARQLFGFAYRQAFGDNVTRGGCGVGQRGERSGMAHRQLFAFDHAQNVCGQAEQAHDIGNVAAGFVDELRNFLLGQAFTVGKFLIGARLFDRVEIFTLQVLDQRERGHFAIIELTHNCGNFVHACAL